MNLGACFYSSFEGWGRGLSLHADTLGGLPSAGELEAGGVRETAAGGMAAKEGHDGSEASSSRPHVPVPQVTCVGAAAATGTEASG